MSSRKFNAVEAAETRRLVAWYHGIAGDYKKARLEAVDSKDIGKMAELEQLEREARAKADEYRAQLRKAGLP
jgi:hypothetical protein